MHRKTWLALVLVLALLVSALPISALAAGNSASLTRAEAVTALWEAAGAPEPARTDSPFTDVDPAVDCYPAVLWAVETGLTDGTGGGRFSPDAAVDRAQLVTFLWKQAGKPAPEATAVPFSDVAADAWYAPAVLWALEAGIVDGGESSFNPGKPVDLTEVMALAEAASQPVDLLSQLQGSYVELFPEMSLEKYLPVWSEVLVPYCSSADELSLYYQMFTLRFMSPLYGAEAVEAYSSDPESAMFNCFFLQDVAEFTIQGSTISGVDAEGRLLFRHDYHYLEDLPVTFFGMDMGISMHIYESDDPDAGSFRYFAFSDDTPAETYHLEFRYGGSLEGLTDYTQGEYAYWLASAIAADYDDQTMADCITLFVTENLGEPAPADAFLAIAGENGTTYTNLFSVILDEQYDEVWFDCIAAVTGADLAEAAVQGLKGAISADIYGQAAIDAYSGAGGYAFDCWFINDAALFTINPDYTATITLTDGSTQTYQYEPLGTRVMGADESLIYQGMEFSMATEGEMYQSTEPAGEFSYLFFLPDTMDTTYHLEFRYGSDPDALMGYMKGPYAYWLAAGIDAEADAQTIKAVIQLFCLENMDFSQRSDSSLSQIEAFIGTWNADLSGFGEAYANVSLYFTIDETGHGMTYMNGVNTSDFYTYAYETGDGQGVYVALDNLTYEAEAADYTLETNADGQTVLTLHAADGTISYIKAD